MNFSNCGKLETLRWKKLRNLFSCLIGLHRLPFTKAIQFFNPEERSIAAEIRHDVKKLNDDSTLQKSFIAWPCVVYLHCCKIVLTCSIKCIVSSWMQFWGKAMFWKHLNFSNRLTEDEVVEVEERLFRVLFNCLGASS